MIVWTDVETTGLNERDGSLLEVAVAVTDDDLNIVASTAVVCAPVGIEIGLLQMDDVVKEMHTRNGLLEEVKDHGVRRYEAEAKLIQFVTETALSTEPLNRIPLVGSTISFDRRWLKEHMPLFEAMFSYRSIDVSSFTEMVRRWAPAVYEARPQGSKEHRALPDIVGSIALLKYYREQKFVQVMPRAPQP